MNLYKHQQLGVEFLTQRKSAGLFWEMGTGKSRTSIAAAQQLFAQKKIARVLICCPAAVRYAWGEEFGKLISEDRSAKFTFYFYNAATQSFDLHATALLDNLEICVISYSLLQQERHVKAIEAFCSMRSTLLICDESSFVKNRNAKQTHGALKIAQRCSYRWLLTGTPIANSPLDLYAQGLVMNAASVADGPLKGFHNFYHFRYTYGVMGGYKMKQVVAYKNLDKLQKRFAHYVSRLTKKQCLDLPAKSYTTREVTLTDATWRIYKELQRDALLALGKDDVHPEPNAATRIMRLCQLTSGHVSVAPLTDEDADEMPDLTVKQLTETRDISAEKLHFLLDELNDGELSSQQAIIVWCRWRRERERLKLILKAHTSFHIYEVFGGQSASSRSEALSEFTSCSERRVLLAQPHAGGYGLNLTAAHTAVFLSNDFSHTARIQAEDRCHRIGQKHNVEYVDVLARGPAGQQTVDHRILKVLREKKDLATLTCSAWRAIISD